MVHIMEATTSSGNTLVSHSLQEERRGVKRKISLISCDMCGREESKYRCPNCLKYSCSLPCVKRHKRLSGCSGVRDQTAFVPLSQFEEINLLNDYRFLEETARMADGPRRDALLRQPLRQQLMGAVVDNARKAKINLQLLPKSFTRRRENTTFYSKAERKLYWHLKLLFPQCSAEYSDRVQEDRVLEKILSDYIHPSESDPVKRQRLKMYVPAYPDQLFVFMKSEQRQPNSLKYHKLDVTKSLRENLMFKRVLEYPELHVVLKEHQQEYLARIPGRSGVVAESGGPRGSLPSKAILPLTPPAAPGALRDLEHPSPREDRTQSMSAETELEEGEIRSDDEEEEDEQEHCSAGCADQNVTMGTDDCLLHDVKEEDVKEDVDYCAPAKGQTVTIETNQDSNVDGVAVKEQCVTMETDNCYLPDVKKEMEEDVNYCATAKCQTVTIETNHDSNVDGVAVKEQYVTMETDNCYLPDVKKEEMEEDVNYCATAKGQAVTIETNQDAVEGVVAVNEQNVTKETDGLPSSRDGDVNEDGGHVGDVGRVGGPDVQNVDCPLLHGGGDHCEEAGHAVMDESDVSAGAHDRPLPHGCRGGRDESRAPSAAADEVLPEDGGSRCGGTQPEGCIHSVCVPMAPCVASSSSSSKTEAPGNSAGDGEPQAVDMDIKEELPQTEELL